MQLLILTIISEGNIRLGNVKVRWERDTKTVKCQRAMFSELPDLACKLRGFHC